jgi:hypothetical protein
MPLRSWLESTVGGLDSICRRQLLQRCETMEQLDSNAIKETGMTVAIKEAAATLSRDFWRYRWQTFQA